jgi:hypothetical protein
MAQTPGEKRAYQQGVIGGGRVLKNTVRNNKTVVDRARDMIANSDAYEKDQVIKTLSAMIFIIDYSLEH